MDNAVKLNLFYPLFILVKIKEKSNSRIVDVRFLTEEIKRIATRNGGFPSKAAKYILEDMVKLKLVERKNKIGLYLLNEHPGERRIKTLIKDVLI